MQLYEATQRRVKFDVQLYANLRCPLKFCKFATSSLFCFVRKLTFSYLKIAKIQTLLIQALNPNTRGKTICLVSKKKWVTYRCAVLGISQLYRETAKAGKTEIQK